MKLEGSLDAFGLADVCTLLASTGKSGALELVRNRHEGALTRGVVWFASGEIGGASADLSRQHLARRVIGSGAVDDLALRHAVARVVSGGVGVSRALLEAGSLDSKIVQSAAREQITDAVSELLTWCDGDFSFNADVPNPDDVGVHVPVADALIAAKQRIEQWEHIHGLIPGPDCVLTLAPGLSGDPTMNQDEWAVVALVDGKRSVLDLAELTGSGLFVVSSILATLIQRSLVTIKDPISPDHVAVLERRLAMLMSIEASETVGRSTVVKIATPSAPGGRGLTTAAALSSPVSSAYDGPDVRAASEAQMPHAARVADVGVVNSFGESVTSTPARGQSLSLPGGFGASALAAHATSTQHSAHMSSTVQATAMPLPDSYGAELVGRDPSLNRTLLLRLIAGVRGL